MLFTTQDSRTIPCTAPHTYHESLSKGMEVEDAVKVLKQVSQISDEAEHVENVAKAAFYVQSVVMNESPDYSWAHGMEVSSKGQ